MRMVIAIVTLALGMPFLAPARSEGATLGEQVYEDPTARVWLSDPETATETTAPGLTELVHLADVIARARINDPEDTFGDDRPASVVVEAELIEILKGTVAPGPISFAPRDPMSTAEYTGGEEVLLFLQRMENDPERADTRVAERADYVSLQNADDEVVLTTASARDAFAAAVRSYVAADALTDPAAQLDARRRIAAELLKSPDPRLAAWAAQDLAAAGDAPVVTQADLPSLDRVIDDPRVPIETRVALLARLEQQRLVFGPTRWVQLLRKTRGNDQLVVVRAAATRPSTAVSTELGRLVQEGDAAVATAAAVGLGHPGNIAAVEPLARALGRSVPALQFAALSSLGRIGTFGARHVLEMAAASHPDPSIRARASTEAIALARRQGTTLAPMMADAPTGERESSAQ